MTKAARHIILAALPLVLAACGGDVSKTEDSSGAVYGLDPSAAAEKVSDTWHGEPFPTPLAESAWGVSLQAVSTDSLFKLGTDYTLNVPTQPDSALVCFMTAAAREPETRDRDEFLEIGKCYVNAAHVYSTIYHQPCGRSCSCCLRGLT